MSSIRDLQREERKGMSGHTIGQVYISRTIPVGSPETFFRLIFRKNPQLPHIAQQLVSHIAKNGPLKATRYHYRKLASEWHCSTGSLQSVCYKLVAVGLLNREEGVYKLSGVMARRLEEMLTVLRDIGSRRAA